MDRDFIWEGDYGNRTHLIPILKELLNTQDANSLQMIQAFVNNNPYSLEFFLVLSYKHPKEMHIENMKTMLKNAALVYRPDITIDELFGEFRNRRFNSSSFFDAEVLELDFKALFRIVEKRVLIENGYKFSGPLGRQFPVFLSHQSENKSEVEELIPYLNGEGLPIWIDKYNIDYGESIVEAIQKGISTSGAVVFWITKEFLNSNWCKKELSSFLNRFTSESDVLIIPVISSDVEIEELESIFPYEIKYLSRGDKELKEITQEIIPPIKRFYNKNFKR